MLYGSVCQPRKNRDRTNNCCNPKLPIFWNYESNICFFFRLALVWGKGNKENSNLFSYCCLKDRKSATENTKVYENSSKWMRNVRYIRLNVFFSCLGKNNTAKKVCTQFLSFRSHQKCSNFIWVKAECKSPTPSTEHEHVFHLHTKFLLSLLRCFTFFSAIVVDFFLFLYAIILYGYGVASEWSQHSKLLRRLCWRLHRVFHKTISMFVYSTRLRIPTHSVS